MNRWHLSSWTLAATYLRHRRPLPSTRSLPQWRTRGARSYTTVLAESLPDESVPLPSSLPSLQQPRDNASDEGAIGRGDPESSAQDNGCGKSGSAEGQPRRKRRVVTRTRKTAVEKDPGSPDGGHQSTPQMRVRKTTEQVAALRSTPSRLRARLQSGIHGTRDVDLQRRRRVLRSLRVRRRHQRAGTDLEPKWISLMSNERPSAEISSFWNRKFAILNQWVAKTTKSGLKDPPIPTFDPEVYEWLGFTLKELDVDTTKFSIGDIPQQSRRGQRWMFMQLSLWLLRFDPAQMIELLRATHFEPYPPIDWVEDSLCHLAKVFTLPSGSPKPIEKQRLLELFHILAYRSSGERIKFVNDFVSRILPHCTAEEVCDIYRTIAKHGIAVHGFTLLHIATRAAKDCNFDIAAEALLGAKDAGVKVNRANYRSACSTVIRSCMSQPEGLRACLQLVSELVDTGLQLNGPICDIIMLNAVDAGDVNTAFAVYRSLMERGLKPRETTFAILLKGCKLHIDDADMLNAVIRDAIDQVNVRQSVLVATEILHCLALHHTKHNPTTALSTITEAYSQLFDIEPLRLLGLPLPAAEQQRASTEPAMQPSPHALGFMISASIHRIQTYSTRPDDIAALYTRWREQVEAHHPMLSQLAATDHTANIFLMALIRTAAGLVHAAKVVRDMQRPLPSAPPHLTTPPVTQCPPTVQTFSIFLHGFTRHGKTQLAEQVLSYMRSKGLEPNDVTWNTLLLGYARGQDVEGAFEVLRRAESSGYLWDRWTEDAVGWLKDRGKVAREMERRRRGQSGAGVDFAEELKGAIGERIAGNDGVEEEDVVGGQDQQDVREVDRGQGFRYVPTGGDVGSTGELAKQRSSS